MPVKAVLCLAVALAGCLHAQGRIGRLDNLYQTDRWFEFRDAVLSAPAPAFYRGAVAFAFHDWDQAEKDLRPVFESPASGDDGMTQALEAGLWLLEIYERSGRRNRARALLSKLQAWFDSHQATGAIGKEAYRIFGAVRGVEALLTGYPDQSVARRAHSRVQCRLAEGRLYLPLTINGKSGEYLLDTGSSHNFLTESEARRLGLTVHPATIGVDGPQAQTTGVAVAKDVVAGDFHLRNVVFLIASDEGLLGFDGLIGQPLLLAWETVRWHADGSFEIGFPPQPRDVRRANLCFANGLPLAEADFAAGKLSMMLDTGTPESRLFPPFRRDYPDFASRELKLRIGEFEAPLATKTADLKSVHSFGGWTHGWLGMDLLGHGKSVTLDFAAMRVTLEGGAPHAGGESEARRDAPPPAAAPDAGEIMRRSAEREWLTFEPPRDYVFRQEKESRRLDVDGKVTDTTTETHEVIVLYDKSYERLIAKNGKPLPPAKDRAEQARFDKAVYKRAHESPRERAKREEAERKQDAERRACGAEFATLFDFRLTGTEAVNGRPAWMVDAQPLGARAPRCRENKFLDKFRLRFWIDQTDYRWARLEADNIESVTWAKLLFRAPRGALHLAFEQVRLPDAAWLPARLRVKLVGKALLFATVRQEILFTYSGYRKFHADSRLVP